MLEKRYYKGMTMAIQGPSRYNSTEIQHFS